MPIGAAVTWDDVGLRRQYRPEPRGTYLVRRIRGGKRKRWQVRVGAVDRALTPNAGMAAVAGLCERLGVIGALDAAVGPVKLRDRGFGAGQLLAGLASAQLAGEDFLVVLDRQRADAAGKQLTPVPGLASTTAGGVARRITGAHWLAGAAGPPAGRGWGAWPRPRGGVWPAGSPARIGWRWRPAWRRSRSG